MKTASNRKNNTTFTFITFWAYGVKVVLFFRFKTVFMPKTASEIWTIWLREFLRTAACEESQRLIFLFNTSHSDTLWNYFFSMMKDFNLFAIRGQAFPWNLKKRLLSIFSWKILPPGGGSRKSFCIYESEKKIVVLFSWNRKSKKWISFLDKGVQS